MWIEWQIGERVRCDIVGYKAPGLQGKRSTMRFFPTGSRQGRIAAEDLGSMVIRAPIGTRVVLMTHPGSGWFKKPWRCIRLMTGSVVPPAKGRLYGVRIPDLDLMHAWHAKKVDFDNQSTYPIADGLEDGTHWTFGGGGSGGLKGNVQIIRIEREDEAIASAASDEEPTSDSTPVVDALVALAVRLLKSDDAEAWTSAVHVALREELTERGVAEAELDEVMARVL